MVEPIFIVNVAILLLLIVIAVIDIKNKGMIPSYLTTMTLLLTFIFYFDNLIQGIVAMLFAFLLYEIDYLGGMADVKGAVIIGLASPTFFGGLLTPLFLAIIGNVYIISAKKILNLKEPIAFFPVFPIIHVGLWILYSYI
jgi:hypothetical protein|tara:strand:+ start:1145 stop:1564 length:420 start_codon:yes stop_codon:yes gene_type:complete